MSLYVWSAPPLSEPHGPLSCSASVLPGSDVRARTCSSLARGHNPIGDRTATLIIKNGQRFRRARSSTTLVTTDSGCSFQGIHGPHATQSHICACRHSLPPVSLLSPTRLFVPPASSLRGLCAPAVIPSFLPSSHRPVVTPASLGLEPAAGFLAAPPASLLSGAVPSPLLPRRCCVVPLALPLHDSRCAWLSWRYPIQVSSSSFPPLTPPPPPCPASLRALQR